jgi:hypothetical protein
MNTSGIEHRNIIRYHLTKELNIVLVNELDDDFFECEVITYEPLISMEENKKRPLFIKDLLYDLEKVYRFSEYYFIISQLKTVRTPKSYLFNIDLLLNGCFLFKPHSSEHCLFNLKEPNCSIIDKLIQSLPGKKAFARLDSCSSKETNPFLNAQEIFDSFRSSERTNQYLYEINHILVIREWVDLTNYDEIRCFVYQSKLRGISSSKSFTKRQIHQLSHIVDEIICATEYDSCSIDLCINDDDVILIEINSPVWLFATSGYFDLTDPFDYEVLLGEELDMITYPQVRREKLN